MEEICSPSSARSIQSQNEVDEKLPHYTQNLSRKRRDGLMDSITVGRMIDLLNAGLAVDALLQLIELKLTVARCAAPEDRSSHRVM